MPEKETLERAAADKRAGKSASTQAGEFVREEIHHVREGKHGARSAKQTIAIGLSKARRAGVKLGVPKGASSRTRAAAARDSAKGRAAPSGSHKKGASRTRSRATREALRHEGHSAATPAALGRQAHAAAKKRGPAARSAAARKAARTRARRGT